MFTEGYGWLPNRRRRSGDDVVHIRLPGKRMVAVCGPEATRFFYDEANFERDIPMPVQDTLFGRGAVHTLNGEQHRARKAMFMELVSPDSVVDLVNSTMKAWDAAAGSWADGHRVVLFDEASRVLTKGVCEWAGVPLRESEVDSLAADLVAMVDGFATAGPRHWRARRARSRREAWFGKRLTLDAFKSLEPHTAAVELLNVIRPTVAVSWYVMFAAHALHRWPRYRAPLAAGGGVFVEAFTHELRRFYPFAPFLAAKAQHELTWRGHTIPQGSMVLLDVYGQHHHTELWDEPYRFDPQRFAGRSPGEFDLIPQGGGDPRTGHRCPGEAFTTALLQAFTVRLARMDYEVPKQDLGISLRRIPAKVSSGFVLAPKARVNSQRYRDLPAAVTVH
ncbi:cytochrome P450 [Kibdelosporangium persicum]|uniref:Fatty-acid peroxygenase n=1 Tax=Kibdelosporangium persicum TaxID=2698649 RepID=A0ABX2F246_9PSEU|nr:cytochrome P450 [Kibdelosporangium persicum]NRN64997.1 Fatty-acid peroxygenase [Kibdelosporangium persicum]